MSNMRFMSFGYLALAFVTVFSFQNCKGGSKSTDEAALSSTGTLSVAVPGAPAANDPGAPAPTDPVTIVAPPPAVKPPVVAAPVVNTLGYVDPPVPVQGGVQILGWACTKAKATSIAVHVYINGQIGKGTLLTGALANGASEPAVQSLCTDTTSTPHRYFITIDQQTAHAHAGQPIYVYGIGADQTPLLKGSGQYTMPDLGPVTAAPGVGGFIDGVTKSAKGDVTVTGWACAVGVIDAIGVHLYVDGPAGTGTAIMSVAANLPSEEGISIDCGNLSSAPHRFAFAIGAAQAAGLATRTIFVHGINPVEGGPNPLIRNSGVLTFPR